MSRIANNALLGSGVRVRVWIREQRKVKRRCKGTTKPLLAILDISLMQLTLFIWYIQYVHTNVDAVRTIDDSIYVHIVSYPDPPSTLQEERGVWVETNVHSM